MARVEGTLQGVIVYSSGCSKGPYKHLSHRGTDRSRQRMAIDAPDPIPAQAPAGPHRSIWR
jgi:hypothetical protein